MFNFTKRRALSMAMAAALSASLFQFTSSALAASDTSVMTGTLVAPSGVALAGVTITASVEPNAQQMADFPAGTEVKTVPIGTAVTTAAGSFSLSTSNVQAAVTAIDDESVVAIVLTAETTEGQLFYRTRLVYKAPATLQAYQPDVDTDLADTDSTRSRITGVNSDGIVALTLVTTTVTPNQVIVSTPPPSTEPSEDLPVLNPPNCKKTNTCLDLDTEPITGSPTPGAPESVIVDPPRTDRPEYNPPTAVQKVKMSTLSASEASAQGSYDPDIWCGGNHWYRKKSADTVGRNVAIFDQATKSKTTGYFNYELTKSTSLEIGVTNRAGSLAATFGMSKGSSTTASVEAPIGTNTNAEWWVSYVFNIYDVMCQSNTTGAKWWSGYSEYRAKKFDGSSSHRSWTVFTCNTDNARPLGQGYTATISKGKTATKTHAFAIGGTDLKATQGWGSSASVKFIAKTSTTSYTLCGSGGIWSDPVSRVRQI
jgi:hypothetical protein